MHQCGLGMNSIHGTGIYASATVDTGIGIDSTLTTLLANCAHWTAIVTSTTVNAVIINGMGHGFTSL
jgi:hypothetical protein